MSAKIILISLFFLISLVCVFPELTTSTRILDEEIPKNDPSEEIPTVPDTTENITDVKNETNSTPLIVSFEGINKTTINGESKLELMKKNCHFYEIIKNYSSMELEFEDLKNVTNIFVSDTELNVTECNPNIFKCLNESKYCLTYDNITKKSLEIKAKNCLKKMYVYVYINETNFSNQTFGKLKVEIEDEDDDICGEASYSDWEFCSNLSLNKCGSENSLLCDQRCKWVNCKRSDEANFSMCLSKDAEISNKSNELCLGNSLFASSKPTVSVKYCGLPLNQEELAHTKPFSIGMIVVIVVFILLFLFLLSICWYRMKLGSSKVQPFTPPSCCPDWIYPRPDSNSENLMEAQDYRPPS